MPKINSQRDGGTIIWDAEDWTAGLSTQFDTGFSGYDNGLLQSQAMNPYRFKGMLSPHFNPTDVTNVSIVDVLIRKSVVNNTFAYTIGNGALMHRITISSGALTNDTAGTGWPHTLEHPGPHSAEVGNDIVLYNAKIGGTSALRVFYSFSDATDWDIGCTISLAATPNTFDDDFMSTAPATPLAAPYLTGGLGYPHPLIIGDDDLLYVGDRNFLHGYDGQNVADDEGKFFPAVLTLPIGFIINSLVKYQQFMVIFAYQESAGSGRYNGESKAFFWDYLSLDPTYIYSLNDNFVSESFNFQGTIGCFTQGNAVDPAGPSSFSKVTKLQLFDGNKFAVVTNACIDKNAPIRGGVSVIANVIQWNSQGTIYQFGTPDPKLPQVLNSIGYVTGNSSGMYVTLGNINYVSSGITTTGGLQTLSTNYSGNVLLYGQLAKPNFPELKQGRIKSVRIKWAKASTGGRNIFVLFRDRVNELSTIISDSNNLITILSTGLVTKYEYDYLGQPLLPFDSLLPGVGWGIGSGVTDAPIIDSIEIYYELINIPVV